MYASGRLPQPVWQLWLAPGNMAELQPLTPARFPNAKLHDDSVFDAAPRPHSNGSMLYSTQGSGSGTLQVYAISPPMERKLSRRGLLGSLLFPDRVVCAGRRAAFDHDCCVRP